MIFCVAGGAGASRACTRRPSPSRRRSTTSASSSPPSTTIATLLPDIPAFPPFHPRALRLTPSFPVLLWLWLWLCSVYGPSVHMQEYFKDPKFPANLPEIWMAQWGFAKELTGTASHFTARQPRMPSSCIYQKKLKFLWSWRHRYRGMVLGAPTLSCDPGSDSCCVSVWCV